MDVPESELTPKLRARHIVQAVDRRGRSIGYYRLAGLSPVTHLGRQQVRGWALPSHRARDLSRALASAPTASRRRQPRAGTRSRRRAPDRAARARLRIESQARGLSSGRRRAALPSDSDFLQSFWSAQALLPLVGFSDLERTRPGIVSLSHTYLSYFGTIAGCRARVDCEVVAV